MSDERYQIKKKIGQGGIGAVYEALDTRLQRHVAIKRLLPLEESSQNKTATADLRKEASVLSSLASPHIVTVYDAGKDEDGVFVVMELIKGETLDQTIRHAALPLDDFTGIVHQSLDGLIAAHEVNLLHRDIKPKNIMITWLPSGKFQLKLLDFGLAKFSVNPSLQTLDHNEKILGSVHYMAPEQFERRPLDARVDLYSLGCVLYFALAQGYAFEGDTPAGIMNSHLEHKVTPLHEVRKDIPRAYSDWVMRLINRHPNDRPDTAKAALEEFRTIEKNKEVIPVGVPLDKAAPIAKIIPHPTPDTTAQGVFPTGPVTARQRLQTKRATPVPRAAVRHSTTQKKPLPPKNHGASRTIIISALILTAVALIAIFMVTSSTDDRPPQKKSNSRPATSSAKANAKRGPTQKGNAKPAPRLRLPPLPKSGRRLTHFIAGQQSFSDNGKKPATPGSPVRRWDDLAATGGNNYLYQPAANPDRQPTLETASNIYGLKGSFPVLAFKKGNTLTASRTGMGASDPLNSNIDKGEITIFTVFRSSSDRPDEKFLTLEHPDKKAAFRIDRWKGAQRAGWLSAPAKMKFAEVDSPTNSFNLLTYVCHPASKSHRLRITTPEGKKHDSGSRPTAPTAGEFTQFRIGGFPGKYKDKTHDLFAGQVAELIIYDKALSDEEITQVEKYLFEKYFSP